MSSQHSYRYRMVDVFTNRPLEGNPLAVFPNAVGLSAGTMQKIAQELNLSETTFVLPSTRPDCVARVRIFTPAHEMTFAGHPTIGTAWVLLNEGVIAASHGQFSLEEQVGPVPVRMDSGEGSLIWLTTPPIAFEATISRDVGAALLGLLPTDLLDVLPQHVTAGNPTLFVAVKDPLTVDRAALDPTTLQALKVGFDKPFCVFVFAPTPSGAYSRMFAPDYGIPEDPATGSATGPLAAFMMRHGLVSGAAGSRWVSEQGTKMGRRSLLHILVGEGEGTPRIEVGGNVAPLAEASLTI